MFRLQNPCTKKQAIEFFAVFGIVALFLIFLGFVFGGAVGTILVVLCSIVFLGILRARRPDIFPPYGRDSEEEEKSIPPIDHPVQHTYMMLIDLSVGGRSPIDVNASPFVIGKAVGVNYRILDDQVSRGHLTIEYEPDSDSRYITDNSTNGTYINSRRLPKGVKTPVHHGDMLQIGQIAFSVEFVNYYMSANIR